MAGFVRSIFRFRRIFVKEIRAKPQRGFGGLYINGLFPGRFGLAAGDFTEKSTINRGRYLVGLEFTSHGVNWTLNFWREIKHSWYYWHNNSRYCRRFIVAQLNLFNNKNASA